MASRATSNRRWIEPLARFGFAARGLVYILVGLLAAEAAAVGGRATDARGAIQAIGQQHFGTVFLLVLALGLAAYALWRFAQAWLDLERKGTSLQALATRATFVVSGLGHAALALSAASVVIGLHEGRSNAVRTWVTRLLSAPYGRWVVAAVGLAVIGSGVYQFYKAYTALFENDLLTSEMSAGARLWSRRVGRAGLTARGVTFGVIGWFLLRAGLDANAHEARGVAGALRLLGRQDEGHWLLFVVAVGLAAYGLSSLVDARYRRIT
ncbi:MAG: hypothetical protein DMF77_09040 [Acidobacteria bacterium]|nr:MAG: hypothetical protein DMF77_09040 [Acidobacteriota bacterium]